MKSLVECLIGTRSPGFFRRSRPKALIGSAPSDLRLGGRNGRFHQYLQQKTQDTIRSYTTQVKAKPPTHEELKKSLHKAANTNSSDARKPAPAIFPQAPTNLATLRLAVGDNYYHACPGMKLTPQFHMPSLLVDAHNPPPSIPSDVHCTFGWFRGPLMENVQQGMVAHTRSEIKDPALWTKLSSKRNYTPTAEDAMHVLKFVIYGQHKPGSPVSTSPAQTLSSSPLTTTPTDPSGPVAIGKYIYFVAPSTHRAPTRRMIKRKTDIEADLLPETYSFSVMSWNVLAQRYTRRERMSNCPDYALTWDYRKDIILDENLLNYEPDLIALQECEDDAYASFFQPNLSAEGYSSHFEKRGSVTHDGCALFVKTSKFKLVKSFRVDFDDIENDFDLKPLQYSSATFLTHNVALISLLELKHPESHLNSVYGKRFLWVLNAHNYADLQSPHIKLLQASFLLDKLSQLRLKFSTAKDPVPLETPVIFMGDLNSTHKSSLYEFVTNGQLIQTPKEGIMKDLIRTKKLQHSLKFKNAHQAHGEIITNLTLNFAGCLDYIFHTPNLVPLSVLENPITSDYDPLRQSIKTDDYMGFLPNPSYPSDHLPLMVQFGLTMNPSQSL